MKLFTIELPKETLTVNQLTEYGRPLGELNDPSAYKKKVVDIFVESSQYEVLFSDYTRGDLGAFIQLFMNPRSSWLEVVRENDHRILGSLYLTDIIPKHDALGHFAFWDSRVSGRQPLIWRALEWAFDRYELQRVTVEPPIYQGGLIRFIKELGFIQEGRRRRSVMYKGEWFDTLIFGILREEVPNGSQHEERNSSRNEGSDRKRRRNVPRPIHISEYSNERRAVRGSEASAGND